MGHTFLNMTPLALRFRSWSLRPLADTPLSVRRGGRAPFPSLATSCVTTTQICSQFLSWAPVQRCFRLCLYLQEEACMKQALEVLLRSMWNNSSRRVIYDGILWESFWPLRCLWKRLA